MPTELRKSGISVVGDAPWGTHFCHFYETKQDLLDTLVPYFKAGLESKEFCLWVVSSSDLITVEEATEALAQAVPDFDRHLSNENIEILDGLEWYLEKNVFNLERVKRAWDAKLERALARGYDGLRVSGDTFWLAEQDWRNFGDYEKQLNDWVTDLPMTLLCTYPLTKSRAAELLDVVQSHQFAIARRQGEWEVIETPELIQAKAEIKRLNEVLEQRVVERTNELRLANEELSKEITERRQAEALLHAKEQEFRAIVENAPDHIARYNTAFRRTYANPALAKSYDVPPEALIGKPMFSIIRDAGLDINEDVLAQISQRFAAVFDTGESYEFEITLTMPPGRRDYSVRLFPELDLNGSVINVLSIARDITESKRAEVELKKEKEVLKKIFDNIPLLIGFVGDDGRVKLVNPEWERTIGWTLKELDAQSVDIFVEAYPDPRYRQQVLDFVAAATGEWVDLKIRVRDGRMIDAACAVVHLSDGTKVAIAQDITERKEAEEKLKQREFQLAEAQRLAQVGSWEWDLRSNALTWSDELYRIFGLEPGEINVAGDAMPFIHSEDRDLVLSTVQSSVKNKAPYSFYYRALRPDGEERILHSRGHIVTDEYGEPIKVFGATQDLTDLKRAEEKLKATTEQLRALSARLESAREEEGTRIARELHDELGGTLTSLKWDLESFDKVISESDDQPQLQVLRERIEAMLTLTDTTIGTVRRISSELRPSVLDDLGLGEAIEWQAQQFQARTGIICQCDCSLENLNLSREQSTAVFRIFQAALTNIIRHAQATRVKTEMKEEAGEFILTISDNGRGIKDDEKSGSRALGLLGMRERAHLIGGKIEINGFEGEGTVVTLRIPISR